MEQPEGEGGGDQHSGQVALLQIVQVLIFFGMDTFHFNNIKKVVHLSRETYTFFISKLFKGSIKS